MSVPLYVAIRGCACSSVASAAHISHRVMNELRKWDWTFTTLALKFQMQCDLIRSLNNTNLYVYYFDDYDMPCQEWTALDMMLYKCDKFTGGKQLRGWYGIARTTRFEVEKISRLIWYCKRGLFRCVKDTALDMVLQARFVFKCKRKIPRLIWCCKRGLFWCVKDTALDMVLQARFVFMCKRYRTWYDVASAVCFHV